MHAHLRRMEVEIKMKIYYSFFGEEVSFFHILMAKNRSIYIPEIVTRELNAIFFTNKIKTETINDLKFADLLFIGCIMYIQMVIKC